MSSHLTTSVKVLLTFLVMLQLTTNAKTKKQDPPVRKDSSTHVLLNAKITLNAKDHIGSYKLEVLYRDMVINSMSVKNNSVARLLLKKDAPYVLKISKKGYVPRYICINTNMHDKANKNVYYLNLETDFIPASEAMTLDDEALQLPAALVSYSRKAGNFEYNKDYSLFVQKKLYGLEQASAAN